MLRRTACYSLLRTRWPAWVVAALIFWRCPPVAELRLTGAVLAASDTAVTQDSPGTPPVQDPADESAAAPPAVAPQPAAAEAPAPPEAAAQAPPETDLQLIDRAFQQLPKNPAAAAEIARERLQRSPSLPPKQRAFLLWIGGSALSITGRHLEALQLLDEAEQLARELQDRKLLRRVLRYIAASAFETGAYRRGLNAAQEGLQISAELQDTSSYVGFLHNELAGNAARLGELEQAVEHYRLALQVAEASGNRRMQSMIIANLAPLYEEQEQYDAAIEMLERALALAVAEDVPLVIAAAQLNLGGACLKAGQLSRAQEQLTAALERAQSQSADDLLAAVHQGLGDLAVQRQQPVAAEHHFRAALAIWERLQQPEGRLAAEQRLAALDVTRRETAEVLARLEAALREARRLENRPLVISLLNQLAQTSRDQGDWQAATQHLQALLDVEKTAWRQSADQALAEVRTQLQVAEQRQAIAELEHQNALQQTRLFEQRRQLVLLVGGLAGLLVILFVLWRTLAAKRRAILNLVVAEAELRQQRQLQIAIERRIAEQQRTESLALMAAGIAHDFNNQLTAIAGLSELGTYCPDADKRSELFEQITSATFQAAELTAQLLQFLGRPSPRQQSADIAAVVESARGLLMSIARPRATVELQVAAGPLPAEIQDVQVRQILVNLVSNAAEAMGPPGGPGRISVRTGRCHLSTADLTAVRCGEQTQPGEFCFLSVADNGQGIPEEQLSRIFDPYFSTKTAGRGLGLASVLGIVRSCCGAIAVRSATAVGAEPTGTEVTIYLPAVGVEETLLATSVSDPAADKFPAAHECAAATVLLVDDEPALLRYLTEILEAAGFRVLTASDAQQALRLLADGVTGPACVVSDFTMPGENGVWLAERIQERHPEIPVVICSGYTPDVLEDVAAVAAFLQKPYVPRELIRVIRRVLQAQLSARPTAATSAAMVN